MCKIICLHVSGAKRVLQTGGTKQRGCIIVHEESCVKVHRWRRDAQATTQLVILELLLFVTKLMWQWRNSGGRFSLRLLLFESQKPILGLTLNIPVEFDFSFSIFFEFLKFQLLLYYNFACRASKCTSYGSLCNLFLVFYRAVYANYLYFFCHCYMYPFFVALWINIVPFG